MRVDVDAATDELYAGRTEEFTARRDELAAQARAGGDRDLAVQIKALRKPTVVAWLANQLARHHGAELRPLLELGDALREATATLSGPDLRHLSRQRNAVVQALVRQARDLAVSLGRPVPESVVRELEQTLLVALADPASSARLAAGRLTEGLDSAGFAGPVVAIGGPARTSRRSNAPRASTARPPTSGPAAAAQRQAERRAELERELERATDAEFQARDAHTVAETAARAARQRRASAQDAVAEARRALEQARTEHVHAEQLATAAAEAVTRAAELQERAAATLEQAQATVRARRHDLDGSSS